uniref:Transposase n=1 Tax=Amegilla dulcifera TaxID=598022 RepID=A0A024FRE0_9HYME|nr:transposase [Amegilla dulcifera]BAO79481.1 transposase [Amegilla dulcifera]BAO79484.1 transposase [Amegilla dulcifera]
MEEQDVHFRHILLYYFRKGKNASQAHKKLCAVYGNEALKERQCRNWFVRFRSGDFSLKNAQRSGRPVEVDEAHIKTIIDSDYHSIIRDIAEKLNVSHTCIEKKLKMLGYVKKLDLWLPHQLKEIHLTQSISICDSLLKRNEIDPFLKSLITADEKWIVYNNVNRKRSWVMQDEPVQTTSRAEIHQKKIMLSVWRDYKGILYFELMPQNQTINSNVHVQQLAKLNDAIQEKRPILSNRKGVVFHHDNAKPYTSLVTRQKLLELGWDVLSHPPYSPNLSPSDYHLFRSMQNSLNGKIFNNADDIRSHLIQFFDSKDQKFYERGFFTLPERWQKVIDKNGQYLIE